MTSARSRGLAALCTVASLAAAAPCALAATAPLTWSAPQTIDPADASGQLKDISCPTTTLCAAIDQENDVVTSTNPTGGAATWTVTNLEPFTPNGLMSLYGVSCAPGLCAIVDQSDNVLISTNPTGGASAWTTTSLAGGINDLRDVSCPSANLCVAVDRNGNVHTSADPTAGAAAWTTTNINGGSMLGVSCPTTALCVATRRTGGVNISTNPAGGAAAWTTVTPTQGATAAACGSAQVCDVGHGVAIVSAGGTSTPVVLSNGSACAGSALCASVSGASDEAAATTAPSAGASAWTTTSLPAALGPISVSCASVSLCVATAEHGQIVVGTPPSAGSPGTPPPGTPPGTSPSPKGPTPVVSLRSRTGKVSAKGVARFEVDCRKSPVACAGTLTITVRIAKTKRAKAHTKAVGNVKYTVKAGKLAAVNVHLSTTARVLIRTHHGRLSADAILALIGVKSSRTLAISLHRG
jgi:hypothetical protein